MSFQSLMAHTARTAAAFFSADEESRPLCLWAQLTPDAAPSMRRADYVLEIFSGVHRGPSRNRTRDLVANLVESERRFSVHVLRGAVPEGLPWYPVKETTVLLVGYDRATAEACRIVDWQDAAGLLELEVERITLTE